MAKTYGRARTPLAIRPSPVTGTMDQWKNWVDGLTRSERDTLYPGMHIDLIPAYEVINQKAALPDTGTGFGTQVATDPGFAVGAKPVSPFGSTTPQGSTALNGLFDGPYSRSPVSGSTPNSSFGNSTQPNTSLGTKALASSLTSPVLPGNPAGTAMKKGLLDLSYAARPEGGSANPLATKDGTPTKTNTSPVSQNLSYGVFGDAWDKFTKVVGDAIEVTAEGYRFAEEFAKYMVEAPRDIQLEFLKDFLVFVGSLTGVGNAANLINLMINNPEERNAYNVISLVVGLLPVAVALKIAPRFYKFMDRATRKFKAARRERKAAGRSKVAGISNVARRALKSNAFKELLSGVGSSLIAEVLAQSKVNGLNPQNWSLAGFVIAGSSGVAGGVASVIDPLKHPLANYLLPVMTTELSTISRQVFVMDESSDLEITGAHIIKEAVDSGYKHMLAGLISLGVKQALTRSIIPHARHDEAMAFMNVLIGYGIDEAYRISTALLSEIQSFSEKLT